MNFLFPVFLFGLLAIAVPVALHLHNRRPATVLPFPTLRFLLKKELRMDRFRNLKRLLVLLGRCLAILCLALAFAWPGCQRTEVLSGRTLLILLDTSASMHAGPAWHHAQETVKSLLDSQPQGTRFALMTFGSSPRIALDADSDPTAIHTYVANLSPGFETENPEAALSAAATFLESQPTAERLLRVVSDFSGERWRSGSWAAILPEGLDTKAEPPSPAPSGNLAITEVSWDAPIRQLGQEVKITASVRNFGAHPQDLHILLEIPGQQTREQFVTLPGFASRQVRFRVFAPSMDPIPGQVRLQKDDGFVLDNTRFFVVEAGRPLQILRWAADRVGDDRFLEATFGAAGGPMASSFEWIRYEGLAALTERPAMVILDWGVEASPEEGTWLQEYVEGGGLVLLLLNEAEVAGPPWQSDEAWLPVKVRRSPAQQESPLTLRQLDVTHPAMALFGQSGGGDLFTTRVTQRREFDPDSSRVIVRFSDGSPALAEWTKGKGALWVSAFPFERVWTDWPLRGTFLPFMHQLAEHGADRQRNRQDYEPGMPLPMGSASAPGIVADPDGNLYAINLHPSESDLPQLTMLDLLSTTPAKNTPADLQNSLPLPQDQPAAPWIVWLLAAVLLFSTCELLLANRLTI